MVRGQGRRNGARENGKNGKSFRFRRATGDALVVEPFSLVDSAIRPSEDVVAMHPVILPLADELASVNPYVGATSIYLVVHPVAIVLRAILPGVGAVAMLLAIVPVALVVESAASVVSPGVCLVFNILIIMFVIISILLIYPLLTPWQLFVISSFGVSIWNPSGRSLSCTLLMLLS